jgi:hypothetical protein
MHLVNEARTAEPSRAYTTPNKRMPLSVIISYAIANKYMLLSPIQANRDQLGAVI